MNTTLSTRIETIAPTLCQRVGIISRNDNARNPYNQTMAAPEPADDLYQQAVLTIIERAETNPEFLNQNDFYIVQAGVWAASHQVEKQQVIERHTWEDSGNNPENWDCELGTDAVEVNDWSINELIDSIIDPEEAVIRSEHLRNLIDAVRRLSPDNQAIVKMLGEGIPESKIAEALHISRPAVSQRKKTIAANLRKFASTIL